MGNPVKSQLMTFGSGNPDNTTVYLDRKIVQWCTKVKYLHLHLIGGADFKIDLLLLNENIMDVLIPLCLLLKIKLTQLWLCILLNHVACHSSCMDVKFGH